MADRPDAPTHKGPAEVEQKSPNLTLLVHLGVATSRRDPSDGEQRALCGNRLNRRVRGGGAGGAAATRVAITAILFHCLSFIKPDKLLKELLSDCCWYAARKQQSASVSKSNTLLSCAGEEGGGGSDKELQRWRQQQMAVLASFIGVARGQECWIS